MKWSSFLHHFSFYLLFLLFLLFLHISSLILSTFFPLSMFSFIYSLSPSFPFFLPFPLISSSFSFFPLLHSFPFFPHPPSLLPQGVTSLCPCCAGVCVCVPAHTHSPTGWGRTGGVWHNDTRRKDDGRGGEAEKTI